MQCCENVMHDLWINDAFTTDLCNMKSMYSGMI